MKNYTIMKHIFFLLFLTITTSSLFAQVIAHAGPDFHSCQYDTNVDDLFIGGTPTAQLGTPPYTYEWVMDEIVIPGGCSYVLIHADDVLDDIHASNPRITDRFAAEQIPFYLTVTDALGNISHDTCVVSFSNFVHNQTFWTYQINLGDSILLNQDINLTGGIPPYTYQWHPADGLTDTLIETGFWAKPTQSTFYYATLTDAMGCQATGTPYYNVIVNTVAVSEFANRTPFTIYPNPVTNFIQIINLDNNEISNIKIFDIQGKLLQNINKEINTIDVSNYISGIYILQIESNQHRFQYKFSK